MTAIDPATCWVPGRYVQAGDVTVGAEGLLPIDFVGPNPCRSELDILVRQDGRVMQYRADPDAMVNVLVPIPERDAGALTVEQLGAVVIGRRTAGAA
jgi:hypothetical protein